MNSLTSALDAKLAFLSLASNSRPMTHDTAIELARLLIESEKEEAK